MHLQLRYEFHRYFLVGVAQESLWIWQSWRTSGKYSTRFFISFRIQVTTATPGQCLSAKGCHLYVFRVRFFLPVLSLSDVECKTSHPMQGAAHLPWTLSDKPISLQPDSNKESWKIGHPCHETHFFLKTSKSNNLFQKQSFFHYPICNFFFF